MSILKGRLVVVEVKNIQHLTFAEQICDVGLNKSFYQRTRDCMMPGVDHTRQDREFVMDSLTQYGRAVKSMFELGGQYMKIEERWEDAFCFEKQHGVNEK